MTLSSALSNALSGLTASSRTADLVASNLANAMTDGFAPRALTLSPAESGQGVSVVGIQRQVDTALLADRRIADSARAAAEVKADFTMALENLIGAPGSQGSLDNRLAEFESAIVTASSRPEETTRLDQVLRKALSLGQHLNKTAAGIADLRQAADQDLERAVTDINAGLRDVVKINTRITTTLARGGDTSSLEDQRQKVINDLSEIVPMRELLRENGAVALVTTSGALLLDGRAVELSFSAQPAISAGMKIETGALSGLRMDNMEVPLRGDKAPFEGGRLSALFDVRDRLAVDATVTLDALAADLVTRFQNIGTNATQQQGLFTESGQRLSADPAAGLAGRLEINAAVDPERGGALFRLRDGLDATTPGAPADSSQLIAFGQALRKSTILPSSVLDDSSRDAAGHVATFISRTASDRISAEDNLSFTAAQASGFRSEELANGVDSDAELQRLLLVEQAFGANARMIQTIDDMLETLLRI